MDDAERDTRRWLERAVIGLNLCPFARSVHVRNQIHFCVSNATEPADVWPDLERELQDLLAIEPSLRETTLLVVPGCLHDFLEFNDFMGQGERLLRKRGLQGILQLVGFHPHYEFADSEAGDVTNHTNRSPYPTIHVLREESIEAALRGFPRPERIYENNLLTLKALGPDGWAALDVGPSP